MTKKSSGPAQTTRVGPEALRGGNQQVACSESRGPEVEQGRGYDRHRQAAFDRDGLDLRSGHFRHGRIRGRFEDDERQRSLGRPDSTPGGENGTLDGIPVERDVSAAVRARPTRAYVLLRVAQEERQRGVRSRIAPPRRSHERKPHRGPRDLCRHGIAHRDVVDTYGTRGLGSGKAGEQRENPHVPEGGVHW